MCTDITRRGPGVEAYYVRVCGGTLYFALQFRTVSALGTADDVVDTVISCCCFLMFTGDGPVVIGGNVGVPSGVLGAEVVVVGEPERAIIFCLTSLKKNL